MKNNDFVMSIAALFMFGSGTSDDELKFESEFVNEMSKFDFERIYDVIDLEKAKLNDKALEKDIKSRPSSERGNNGNGVYIVPFIRIISLGASCM